MPTPCPSAIGSAPGRSMYKRSSAPPPGDGRYSTPSRSRPIADTVGDRSSAMSVDLSATMSPLSLVVWRRAARKNEKGPDGPLVRCCWIRCRRASMRTARARFPQSKKASSEALRRPRKACSGLAGRASVAPVPSCRVPLSRWIIGLARPCRKVTAPAAHHRLTSDLPTRTPVPASMKRSRKTALVLMGSAPLLLVACAQQPEVQTSEGLFTTVEACATETMNPSMCRQAFDQAQSQADAVAPRYASAAECEAEFGEGQCATRQQAGGGSFVGPMMAGFFLSQMMNTRGGAMAPAPGAG